MIIVCGRDRTDRGGGCLSILHLRVLKRYVAVSGAELSSLLFAAAHGTPFLIRAVVCLGSCRHGTTNGRLVLVSMICIPYSNSLDFTALRVSRDHFSMKAVLWVRSPAQPNLASSSRVEAGNLLPGFSRRLAIVKYLKAKNYSAKNGLRVEACILCTETNASDVGWKGNDASLSDSPRLQAVPQFSLVPLLSAENQSRVGARTLSGARQAANRFKLALSVVTFTPPSSNPPGDRESVSLLGFVEKPRGHRPRREAKIGCPHPRPCFVTGRLGGAPTKTTRHQRFELRLAARIAESRWLTKNSQSR